MVTAIPKKHHRSHEDILTVNELVEQIHKADNNHTRKQLLAEVKNRVFRFEPSNTQYIVLYATGQEWYRIGGNSALLYAYDVAPKTDRHPKFKNDMDFYDTFIDGVISVPKKNVPSLTRDLKAIGVKLVQNDELVLVYALAKSVSRSTLARYRKKAVKEIEEYNTIMLAQNMHPGVTGMVRKLLPMIYSLYCTTPQTQREAFVGETLDYVKSIQRIMVAMANESISEVRGLQMVASLIDKIFGNISMMLTVGLIPSDKALVYAKHLRGARVVVNARLDEIESANQPKSK